jgi:biopolymer transport protein ExbD
MARSRKKDSGKVDLNLTSMLDVVFQLIIFFLLVTNFTSAELPKLAVPVADRSKLILDRKKITVNVIPQTNTEGNATGSGQAQHVRVGSEDIPPQDYGRLTLMLKTEVELNEHIEVDLRADQSIHYDQMQPVMNAITNAGIGRVNLVAMTPDSK